MKLKLRDPDPVVSLLKILILCMVGALVGVLIVFYPIVWGNGY